MKFLPDKDISMDRVIELLRPSIAMNQLTNGGPAKAALETLLHSKLGCRQDQTVICLANGTAACHLLLFYHAVRLGWREPQWLLGAYTFPSAAVNGARGIHLVDIDLKTMTIPLDWRVRSEKYDGVIITDLFGANLHREWEASCVDDKKMFIVDLASSPLSRPGDRPLVDIKGYAFGSLHHTKYLGYGEGGFIVAPIAERDELERLAHCGYVKDPALRKYEVLSSNFKMSDVAAAFIMAHIETYDVDKHISVQDKIADGLKGVSGVRLFSENAVLGNLALVFDDPVSLDKFTPGFPAVRCYKSLAAAKHNCVALAERVINMPLNAKLSDDDIEVIIQEIKRVVKR